MSIQDQINRLKTAKTNILTSISNKGVDTTSVDTLDDVPSLIDNISTSEDLDTELTEQSMLLTTQSNKLITAINALQDKASGGVTPTGEISITENGTYDVTEYAEAKVNVPSSQDYTVEDGLITRTITSYSNDRITLIGGHALRGAGITSINCPNVTSIEAYGLESCSTLVDVYLPKVTTLKNYAMQNCKALTKLEFQQKITTQGAVWNNCSSLTTLILRGSAMSGLGNKNCFNGTPIASGTGYIYVPDDLVDTYKANTNWSTYASQIKGISEL